MSLPIVVSFGTFVVPTYTLLLSLAVIGVGLCIWFQYRHESRLRAPIANVLLAVLLGGVIGARLVHVLLNALYFVERVPEALRLDGGGLDWHGALLGGCLAMRLIAGWYMPRLQIDTRRLLDMLAMGVGVLALAAWGGCLASNCAYGKEVAAVVGYPPFVIVETSDEFGTLAPRFNPYGLGAVHAAGLAAVGALCWWRGWMLYRRLWLVIFLLSIGLLAIGFVRGDYAVIILGLRTDQWLDVGTLGVSLYCMRRAGMISTLYPF
jgi:phosphatidylglycerol:prolipoprotein diacylglycerol transferase